MKAWGALVSKGWSWTAMFLVRTQLPPISVTIISALSALMKIYNAPHGINKRKKKT